MRIIVVIAAAILASACGGDERPVDADTTEIVIPEVVADDPAVTPVANADAEPVDVAPAIGSARAAADIVRGYFDRIRIGDAAGAAARWDGNAAAQRDLASRVAGFGAFTAEIGEPGAIEAGAGQRYVDVPFRISATASDDLVPLRGRLTLHRVAEVDGASSLQQRWQIRSVAFAGEESPRESDAPAALTARYRCIDGSRFVADFDNVAGTVTLDIDGERRVLDQQRAASGIWYRGEGYELRGKGDAATLGKPDMPPLACTAG